MTPQRKPTAPPPPPPSTPTIPKPEDLKKFLYRGSGQVTVTTKLKSDDTVVIGKARRELTGSGSTKKRKRKRSAEVGEEEEEEEEEEEGRKQKAKLEEGVERAASVGNTREEVDIRVTTERKSKAVKRAKKEEVAKGERGEQGEVNEVVAKARVVKRATASKKTKQQGISEEEEEESEEYLSGSSPIPKPKKPRKPRKPKVPPMLPFAPRTTSLPYLLGAHVSMAKGVQNAIHNALLIGGNSLALFLKSQRKWASPELTSTSITEFKALAVQHGYNRKHILPHASYLINLAQKDPEKHKQAYDAFLDDLKRCEILGIGLYNFHPGHTGALQTRAEAMERIAQSLNRAHGETLNVITLLENMAGHGSPPIIGSTLEDLRDIIASVNDKSRVGVCIDTCHAFAAGYDLRTRDAFSKFWEEFDRVVGAKYLKALHLNDSKAPLGGRRDLHQHIGQGYLGLEAFRLVVNSERMKGIPLILETPMVGKGESWAEEIKLLESLIGMRGDEGWVLEKAEELQKLGEAERERVGDVVKRREEKVKKQSELEVKREKKREGETEKGVKVKVKGRRKAKADGETGDEEAGDVGTEDGEAGDVEAGDVETEEGVKVKAKGRRKAKADGDTGDVEAEEGAKVKAKGRRKAKVDGDTGDVETGEEAKVRVKSRRKAKAKAVDTEIVKVKGEETGGG